MLIPDHCLPFYLWSTAVIYALYRACTIKTIRTMTTYSVLQAVRIAAVFLYKLTSFQKGHVQNNEKVTLLVEQYRLKKTEKLYVNSKRNINILDYGKKKKKKKKNKIKEWLHGFDALM